MSPTRSYAVIVHVYELIDEERQLIETTVPGVCSSLKTANLFAWSTFIERMMGEDTLDADELPLETSVDKYGWHSIDQEDDVLLYWRVGRSDGDEIRDEFGPLATPSEGGRSFLAHREDSGIEVVVMETKLIEEEVGRDAAYLGMVGSLLLNRLTLRRTGSGKRKELTRSFLLCRTATGQGRVRRRGREARHQAQDRGQERGQGRADRAIRWEGGVEEEEDLVGRPATPLAPLLDTSTPVHRYAYLSSLIALDHQASRMAGESQTRMHSRPTWRLTPFPSLHFTPSVSPPIRPITITSTPNNLIT